MSGTESSHLPRVAPVFTTGLLHEQTERLAILTEECGEVLQVIGKISRHGMNSGNPFVPEAQRESNRELLEKEVSHLLFAIDLLKRCGDLRGDVIAEHYARKEKSIIGWLHYNHQHVIKSRADLSKESMNE